MGAICLIGLTATGEAAGNDRRPSATKTPAASQHGRRGEWDRKPTDHAKLDRKLNDRSDAGGSGSSRAIVTLKPGANIASLEYLTKYLAKRGRKLNIIRGEVVEIPNRMLRKLADNPNVLSVVYDRRTGGDMNRSAIVSGARAVQEELGYDGAGVTVAVIDSGVTPWHDDLTYQGTKPNVQVVAGQRTIKFVDFVNGLTNPYDDNGHGSHVAGIILGNGYDTEGARAGIAPAANLVSLKVLDDHGGGYISNVIAALEWAVVNKAAYNIRVINLSVGASVSESYTTDPLCLAAKQAVDAGIVVVTAAGNLGKNAAGHVQYGGITAPGNAPWVLTVGAYSHEGTLDRTDDKMGLYSSRGPTARDFQAKPDVVATGTGIVSLAVQNSLFYTTKAAYLLPGTVQTSYTPYLSLTGTSMAAPMVAGTIALMMEANPTLTPNLAKAIIEYTAEKRNYDALTQGAGFLNAKGAVDLAKFLLDPQEGEVYPTHPEWSKQILWGNHRVTNGVIRPDGSAYGLNVVWGASTTADHGDIVWGTAVECPVGMSQEECDNIVWGTAEECPVGMSQEECDNIVWGTSGDDCPVGMSQEECDNIVWGTSTECGQATCDNIVWGTECGQADCDNIVWGMANECPVGMSQEDCDNIVWGTADECPVGMSQEECDNIVWGTAEECPVGMSQEECDNIVWGTSGEVDDTVWSSASEDDNLSWGCATASPVIFADPTAPFGAIDFRSLFGGQSSPPPPSTDPSVSPPLGTLTEPTTVALPPVPGVGGGF